MLGSSRDGRTRLPPSRKTKPRSSAGAAGSAACRNARVGGATFASAAATSRSCCTVTMPAETGSVMNLLRVYRNEIVSETFKNTRL